MTLLDRVRDALAPDYEVREEIGRGGMGAVFLAWDPALAQLVAVKVLLPELATARAVERFLREARALAAVRHDRVLRVHRADHAGGLYYSVMEHVRGENLAERLTRGPLPPPQVRRLATDLLDALGAVHGAGLVHRDVKPSNVFLTPGGRAVLGDFGIASSATAADRLTATGEAVGTPLYRAPEQRRGVATQRTDLYAAGTVLYEAATGVAWAEATAAESPWSRVPRDLRGPLQRALRPDPQDRWPDAAAFRRALMARRSRVVWPVAAGVVAVLALLAVSSLVEIMEPEPDADLAVLPFEAVALPDGDRLGRDLAHLATLRLEGVPELRLVPAARAARLGPSGMGPLEAGMLAALRSTYVARATVTARNDRLELHLVVDDHLGHRLPERRVLAPASDPMALADSVALALLDLVELRSAPTLDALRNRGTRDVQARREFLQGEYAFHHNAWARAERHYRAALARDSSFALAEWRLWNVWRWQLTGTEVVDLERLAEEHGDELGVVDRALLAAVVLSPGRSRNRALEAATAAYGYDGYTALLTGDELLHRGPLVGRSLQEAARYLSEAAASEPYLAPAYEHGLLVLLRLGRHEDARAANENLQRTAAPAGPGDDLHLPIFLEQAFYERFEPERARTRRDRVWDATDPARRPGLAFFARMGIALDVPAAQRDAGRRLVAASGATRSIRAEGHQAQGLALLVMGRPVNALFHLDSAAALLDSPAARLDAWAWRVLLPALDVPGVPDAERERGRQRLREAALDPAGAIRARAAWALSLDGAAAGDSAAARRWRDAIVSEGGGERARLRRLADAFEAMVRGQHRRALALTEPLLADQFLPLDRDPFTRAVLHLVRARAFEGQGQPRNAIRERHWSDNQDIQHTLGGRVQAVEVDWTVSPFSDVERARLALEVGDRAEACRLLRRVLWLWADMEPELRHRRERVERLRDQRCR